MGRSPLTWAAPELRPRILISREGETSDRSPPGPRHTQSPTTQTPWHIPPKRARRPPRGDRRVTAALAATSTAQASDTATSVGTDAGSRERAFAAASAEFGVPQPVLEAVSYAQTRWDFNPGHSTSGGYGPMHLVDADLGSPEDAKGLALATRLSPRGAGRRHADARGHLTGLDEDELRTDELANIRGGAALLAAEQRASACPWAPDRPRGLVCRVAASGSPQEDVAAAFADDTFTVLATGASAPTVDGKDVSLPADGRSPEKGQLGPPRPAEEGQQRPVDCPEASTASGSRRRTRSAARPRRLRQPRPGRPADLPKITNIVIHNTEASYQTTLKLVTDPTYVSWQYSLRSSDGHIAQHLEPQDVGWHAGNWYVNSHSIGLEHEGFAATGAQWFSEPMYRTSARLVQYLATKYDIPLDMQHIFGHDQIPGVTAAHVAGMHWDPGPTGTGSTTSSCSERRSARTPPMARSTSCGSCPASTTTSSR